MMFSAVSCCYTKMPRRLALKGYLLTQCLALLSCYFTLNAYPGSGLIRRFRSTMGLLHCLEPLQRQRIMVASAWWKSIANTTRQGSERSLGSTNPLGCISPMTEDLTVGRPMSERSYYLLRLSPWDQAWKDRPSGNTQFLTSKQEGRQCQQKVYKQLFDSRPEPWI